MWQRTIVTVACFASFAAPVAAQPAKVAPAKVTISGKEVGTLTLSDGAKTERFVLLDVDANTKVKVVTNQDVTKFNEQMLAKSTKLFEDYTVKAKKLFAAGNKDALIKADKEFATASAKLQSYFNYYAAEGKLMVVEGELRLVGQLRPYAYQGADKDLGKGKAIVEGTAARTTYEGKMTLAIANGDDIIVVTGKEAQELADTQGAVRVKGVLRLGKNGPLLEAEKIEVVKK